MNFPPWLDKISRMSLAWKISFIMVAIIVLTGTASIIVMETNLASTLYAEHDAKGFAIARNLAANVVEPVLLDNLVHVQLLLKNTQESEHDIIYAFIAGPDNRIISHTFNGGFPKDLLKVHHHKAGETGKREVIETEYGIVHDISVSLLEGEMGYLHLGLSHKNIAAQIAVFRRNIASIIILISLSAIMVSFLISRFVTKPLVSLSVAAENFGKGDLDFRADGKGSNEISALARAFNTMADRLQKDIEKRVAAEKALQKSEALHRSLVENIDLGVTLIDRDHTILMTNAAQAKLFGKPAEEFVGKKCFREFEKRGTVCHHCPGVKAMELKETRETISEGVRDDGRRFTIRIRAFPVLDPLGEASGFIEVVEDITHQKRLDEELQRARKIKSIGTLAGGIAHDFNNLLTGIIGNISLAKEHCKDSEGDLCNRLRETEKAAMRARDLTQQLLTFSSGGSPILSPTDMRRLIMESVDFYLSGSNVKCAYAIADELLFANVDGNQISQVIQNLVTNAKEAMPDGGIIEVGADNVELADSSLLSPGKYVKIVMTDHGTGVDEEDLPKIFDPYFSTKKGGSGLGLAICYSIINRHKGHITAESERGAGTTFTIYLAASPENPVPEERQKSAVRGTGRVLVMDDEEMILDLTEHMLKNLGYEAVLCRNGEEAVELYSKAFKDGKPFDMVLLDLTIPGGMGGKETISRLRELDRGVQAIVSSGYSNDPILSNPADYGFSGCIEKPYTLEKFSMVLRKIMKG